MDARLRETAQAAGYENWSDLTFYVGKISREDCISRFAELLAKIDSKVKELEEARIEKNHDELVWFTFQLDANGRYKEGSFSLSKILCLYTMSC